VNTINGHAKIILGFGEANFIMPRGTHFKVNDALYFPKSHRNLISFKDIRSNGYHIETMNKDGIEYLCIKYERQYILEKLPMLSSGLYFTKINIIASNVTVNLSDNHSCEFTSTFKIWHERLGHPGSVMMRKIVQNSNGHPLKNQKIFKSGEFSCKACSEGKLIIRPSPNKIGHKRPKFLLRIHGDICGPIHPPCGPFRYFMVLIVASTRWSHVCLLTTRNTAFARFIVQIIKLKAQFLDYDIKKVRLDNAGESTSQAFNDYCVSMRIDVEHPVPHVHRQNGMAESLIKRLKLIARPLILRTKLPISIWGHAILHVVALVQIRPSAYNEYSPLQMTYGQVPNLSHLHIFGCAVYVPITPPQRTKMGPQRRLRIYVGYVSTSIIRYLEPQTGDLFTARFADCHF